MKNILNLMAVAAGFLFLQSSVDATAQQASDAQYEEIIARLQALEAESEIRHKLQTYMAALDHAMETADWDNYVTYFTHDAKLIMVEGTRTGRDDIKERMSTAAARMARAAEGRPVRKRADLLSSIEVKVTGHAAASKSRFTFIAENGAGDFEVTGSGLYVDEWALEEGEWRIASRTIHYDMLRLSPSQ